MIRNLEITPHQSAKADSFPQRHTGEAKGFDGYKILVDIIAY